MPIISLIRIHRETLATRDGGDRCFYCWIPLGRAGTPQDDKNYRSRTGKGIASIDHKIPKAQGGTNELGNLVLCCTRCNLEKANKDWQAFRAKKIYARDRRK